MLLTPRADDCPSLGELIRSGRSAKVCLADSLTARANQIVSFMPTVGRGRRLSVLLIFGRRAGYRCDEPLDCVPLRDTNYLVEKIV